MPNIIIASNQPYDMTLQMDSIKFEGNSTAKLCLIPDGSDPTIRGVKVEIKDIKYWEVIGKAFINNPKLPLGREELMFSANNTNDIGAYTNYTNTYNTWQRSVSNMEYPKFAQPYNSLVNKDNSVAKQRGTKAILVNTDQIAEDSAPVFVRVTAEQWTYSTFWQRYNLLYASLCFYGFSSGLAKGYALGQKYKAEIGVMDRVKTILEVYDSVKDIIYLVMIPHSTLNTVILASTVIAPPVLVLGRMKFTDLYAIGKYDKRSNAIGVLIVKILENTPQMMIQQSEMF